jgi:plasmid maintenance system killer protein
VRQINKLDVDLQDEAIEKIELFKHVHNHRLIAVHKLKGRLVGRYSFSVNFKYRIVFKYCSKTEVVLLAIGDHKIYR